ncbi:MAG: DNA topoisomerase VI subunit B [Phycisphaeraceae bacterium]|nr:MAG: DNA topoisomerase VI subunit B [Phycisphaeraceae bacterium]
MPTTLLPDAPDASETTRMPMRKPKSLPRATADSMASKQRDISVSEFFAKNRHLLGFDNPRKALLTTVKEAVDNSLDACEEAGILPDITVIIEDLQPNRPANTKASRYRVTVADNGPGIVRKQVENVFGRLLFGSKFHRLKMSRGQQGIGISAAGMYGLITTGKPMVIHTKPKATQPAHHIELAMNTKTNRAEVTVDVETDDFPPRRFSTLTSGTRDLAERDLFLAAKDYPTGTSVSIELEGRYQKGRGSVDEFLELTAIANPHARFVFVPPSKESSPEDADDAPLLPTGGPTGATPSAPPSHTETQSDDNAQSPSPVVTLETGGVTVFPRAVTELPPETKEIQPHPRGIELGILLQMLKEAQAERDNYTLYSFLQDKFSRVSAASASSFCQTIKATARTRISDIDHDQAERLFKVLQDSKLPPPPTDCLAPIGVRQLLAGLLKGVRAEFYAASSREPDVYRGRPFQIEAALAFGGELKADEPARVIRFANRVPLLYQQSACSSFKAVTETNWRNYDLQHPRGGVPIGPMVIMIHMASVWVPFTSESKEAIADYDEIRKEMKLALQECGRKLGTYLKKRAKMRREGERRDVFQKYIGEIAKACNAISGVDAEELYAALLEQAKRKTAVADLELDQDGKAVKDNANDSDEEGVIIVEPVAPSDVGDLSDAPPMGKPSRAEAAALKVHALRATAEEPTLIDVSRPNRLNQKGKRPKPRERSKETRSDSPGSQRSKAPAKSPRAAVSAANAGSKPAAMKAEARQTSEPTPPSTARPAKPRIQIKLVPKQDPGLF